MRPLPADPSRLGRTPDAVIVATGQENLSHYQRRRPRDERCFLVSGATRGLQDAKRIRTTARAP
jgi:hypothetical protein